VGRHTGIMSAESIGAHARPKAFDTILLGGLIAGVLDGLDAVIFYGWSFGLRPRRLFQGIAGGLVGPRTFHGGWYTTVLGVACHFSIAVGAAAVFYWASRVMPVLWQKPWIFGPTFGVLVYLVMHYIVVPLSGVPKRKIPVTFFEVVDQLFSHTMFVGLPIALMARRSARR
jgi:uncharacterized membrane protein YagU involved in acid resistance